MVLHTFKIKDFSHFIQNASHFMINILWNEKFLCVKKSAVLLCKIRDNKEPIDKYVDTT